MLRSYPINRVEVYGTGSYVVRFLPSSWYSFCAVEYRLPSRRACALLLATFRDCRRRLPASSRSYCVPADVKFGSPVWLARFCGYIHIFAGERPVALRVSSRVVRRISYFLETM